MSFTEIVEELQLLPYDEKIEVKNIIDKLLIEERRKVFLQDHLIAKKMADNGELVFTSDIDELSSIAAEMKSEYLTNAELTSFTSIDSDKFYVPR